MNLVLSLDRFTCPLGDLLLVFDDAGLRALDFDDFDDRMHRLLRLHYGRVTLNPTPAPASLITPLNRYFKGELTALDSIQVVTGGSVFQRKVWAALRQIPAGHTTSYGALAATIGNPGASRAVGMANGANPIGIVVPCHRVIGANGSLTGYAGGVERKRWLLAHESVGAGLFG